MATATERSGKMKTELTTGAVSSLDVLGDPDVAFR